MVTPEDPQQISQPKKLLSTVLDNERFRTALISKNNKIVIDTIKNETDAYSTEQYQELVGELFNVIANRENRNNPDKLDCAIQLLDTVDFGKVNIEQVLQNYGSSMDAITALSDPYGQVTSFIEAGKILAPHLDHNQETQLKHFWQKVLRTFDRHPDYTYIQQEFHEMLELTSGYQEDEGTTPRFSPEVRQLDEHYRSKVSKDVSYKLELWQQTPEFRQNALDAGIDLAKFWNLNDPYDTVDRFDRLIKSDNEILRETLNRNLKKRVGRLYSDLSREEIIAVSDELVDAARLAHSELTPQEGKFEELVLKFQNLISRSKELSPKGRDKIRKDINGFLKRNGLEGESYDLETIEQILQDEARLGQLKESYESKNRDKKTGAELIKENCDIARPVYSLMSRTIDDLYLGDQTGDCTSYKGEGMNSWTVPNWVANPGFNFFKISYPDGKLIAKAGILLTIADGKPSLVIDSLESVAQKSEEAATEAKKIIIDGLEFLETWAKKIGCQEVFMVTYCNSSGLREITEQFSEPALHDSIKALGGTLGLGELRKNLGLLPTVGDIYLQSHAEYFGDEIYQLENRVNFALQAADPAGRIEIEEAAKSADWDRLFPLLVKYTFPTISKYIGTKIEDYEKYLPGPSYDANLSRNDRLIEDVQGMINAEIDKVRDDDELYYSSVEAVNETLSDNDLNNMAYDNESDNEIERLEWESNEVESELRSDWVYLDDILKLEPQEAKRMLGQLYGVADEDLILNRNLRKVKIPSTLVST